MSSHPRADPAHEVGGTTHRPDQPQIPGGAVEISRDDVVIIAQAVQEFRDEFSGPHHDSSRELADRLRTVLSTGLGDRFMLSSLPLQAHDAEAEKQLKEELAEVELQTTRANRAEAKLAQLRKALGMKADECRAWARNFRRNGEEEQAKLFEAEANALDNTLTILNDSDSTEVDNG